jgi:four helix bundle protein
MENAEKNLRVRTKKFAHLVIRLYVNLPKSTLAQVLGRQMLRSGTSVGANCREADRARSKAEFISKIGECLREADETLYWLELIRDESILPAAKLAPVILEANELVAILVTISKRARGD